METDNEIIVSLDYERRVVLVHVANANIAAMLRDLLEEDEKTAEDMVRLNPAELSIEAAEILAKRISAVVDLAGCMSDVQREYGVHIDHYPPHDEGEKRILEEFAKATTCAKCGGPLTDRDECLNGECTLYGQRSCDNCAHNHDDAVIDCPGPCTYDNGLPHWTRITEVD